MAGSKKGERRGNAKPGGAKRKAIKPVSAPPKPTKRSYHRPHLQTEDYMRQIVAVVNGLPEGSNKLPRETMLDVMQYFYREALALDEYYNALVKQLETADSFTTLRDINAEMERIKDKTHELMRTTADVGFKAAGFYHPRLQAIAVASEERSAPDMMRMIMEEIDSASRGRPSWQKPDLKLVGSSKS